MSEKFPLTWTKEALGNIASITVGGTPSTDMPELWGGEIPWMASGDIHRYRIRHVEGRITKKGLQCSNAKLVPPGAVAVALAGQGKTRGTVAITEVELSTNQSVALVSTDRQRLLPEFLFQTLIPRYEELRASSSGGGRGGLTKKILGEFEVWYPNLDAQRRIADLLSAVDDQIEVLERTQQKASAMRLGLFDALLNPSPTTFSGDYLCEDLRPGWKRLSIAEATSAILDFRGRTPLKLGMDWGDGEIPSLSANNVEMGRINFEKECHLGSHALYRRWMTRGDCSKDDVLLTLEAPLGNVALIPDDKKYILSQRVVLLKPNPQELDGAYLYLYLQWRPFQQLLRKHSTGTTATGIRRRTLELLPIFIPPPDYRRRVTEALMESLRSEEASVAEARKLRQLKQAMAAAAFHAI